MAFAIGFGVGALLVVGAFVWHFVYIPKRPRRPEPHQAAGWWVGEESDGHFHVYPVPDLIEHDREGDDCICGPTIEAVPREDGGYGWLLVHHSLDGREQHETKGGRS